MFPHHLTGFQTICDVTNHAGRPRLLKSGETFHERTRKENAFFSLSQGFEYS